MTLLLRLLQCLSLAVLPGGVKRTLDGDTFALWTVGVPGEEKVRVLGVDAAELRDSLGPMAKAFTIEWLGRGSFTVEACRRDSFGRLLAAVYRGTDTLAVDLIAAKLGTPYP